MPRPVRRAGKSGVAGTFSPSSLTRAEFEEAAETLSISIPVPVLLMREVRPAAVKAWSTSPRVRVSVRSTTIRALSEARVRIRSLGRTLTPVPLFSRASGTSLARVKPVKPEPSIRLPLAPPIRVANSKLSIESVRTPLTNSWVLLIVRSASCSS